MSSKLQHVKVVAWERPLRLVSLVGFTAIYAVCFSLIKTGLAFAPPLRFAGLRALLAGAALLGFMVVFRRASLPPRQSWPWLLALALTSTTLTFGAMFLSPGRTGAGIASVLGNTQPLMALVLAAIFLGEPITSVRLRSLLLGLAGVMLISNPALAGADIYSLSGPALALIASAGAAVGTVIVKRMGAMGDMLSVAAWQLIVGSFPLLTISAMVERDAAISWTTTFVSLLLFLTLIGTSLTTVVWYWLVARYDVGWLTLFLFLVPILGLNLAAFAFGERITPIEGIGAILTTAGIGMVMFEPSPKARPAKRQGANLGV